MSKMSHLQAMTLLQIDSAVGGQKGLRWVGVYVDYSILENHCMDHLYMGIVFPVLYRLRTW